MGSRVFGLLMANKVVFMNLSAVDNISDLHTMNGHGGLLTESQHMEPSCGLILIITGKVLMNLFIFGLRHRNVGASFLGHCCISLAVVDFAFLFAISAIHYFQDFYILGVRFTNYHICLFTQMISHTYGILHLPIFLASGLDYYLTIVKSVTIAWIYSQLIYGICVLLLWIPALTYVLQSHMESPEMDSGESHICTLYISSQSFYLSLALLFTGFLVLVGCCCEIVSFVKSLKVVHYAKSTVVLFSFPCGNQWPIRRRKSLLTALVFAFLGTWGPFVVLQIILFSLCAHIPAYMDMNVPWLYFVNSFLIAVAFALKYPDLQMTEKTFSTDPFIDWKYCIMPFIDIEQNKATTLLLSDVTIM